MLTSKSVKSWKNLNLGLHCLLQSKGKRLKSQVENVTFDAILTEILSHYADLCFLWIFFFINKAIETRYPKKLFIYNTKFKKNKVPTAAAISFLRFLRF